MEVRLEFLKPDEFEEALQACPTLFLLIGVVEWHGLHNVLGLDALKAFKICERAALKGGGLVHPPHYGAVGGAEEQPTFIFDREEASESCYMVPWLEQWCREAARNGFKALILLTGHYGAAQQMAVRSVAVKMSQVLGIPVLGIPEYFLALDAEYYGDHAAYFETSLMMDLYPDTVDLNRLGEEPHRGVGGKDPKKYANTRDGESLNRLITDRLARLAERMPLWSEKQLEAYICGEQAVLRRQLLLAKKYDTPWGGWRHMNAGFLNDYPRCLVEEDFQGLESLACKM
ncbi:MAG: creatininase family protein [Spirochaetales bacterium]|nr:creatininase family protein [Spirochaetales bacterium]